MSDTSRQRAAHTTLQAHEAAPHPPTCFSALLSHRCASSGSGATPAVPRYSARPNSSCPSRCPALAALRQQRMASSLSPAASSRRARTTRADTLPSLAACVCVCGTTAGTHNTTQQPMHRHRQRQKPHRTTVTVETVVRFCVYALWVLIDPSWIIQ